MHASIAISTGLFAVAMAQGYSQPPPPAYGQSTTVVPQEYSTYLPEATTLCVDSTSTVTVTCPTTITLTRMQTMTWSEYTTTECDTAEATETAAPVESSPCPQNSTVAAVPTGGSYSPPTANNTQAAAVPAATATGFQSGAGRTTMASGALVAVLGLAAFIL